ncbi:sel1 repeat family protein [Thiorhodococcus mannitoliphagus]|uniref:Sel1 repeat family protein n=1 Tax=Thiorhodococcus mannitoliphagus TaxID=329406 RepID=A0A6P1DZR3_9GAMM|nr:tetratricopeptide repeat protein [Thiorhodococcus mannitoliphagus]NEX21015.1 sel1 repeat family protein [Thiorhodococcus mannitoliphagus]
MGTVAAMMIMGVMLWVYLSELADSKPAEFIKDEPLQAATVQTPGHAIHDESVRDNPDLHRAAESGDAEAQYRVGMTIVQRSWERSEPFAMLDAITWIRKAADQNYIPAQRVLGALYEKGRGLIQDYKLANEWYMRAAEQGDAHAMARLGMLFARGRGVKQDLTQAYVWMNLASGRGDLDAESERNKIQSLLSTAELAAAQERSRSLDAELPRLTGHSEMLPIGF